MFTRLAVVNRYQFAENVLDFVHEVPGCQTAVTVTADCVRRLGDRVDVRIYAYGHYNRAKVVQEAKQGHPFWYYDNGTLYGHSTRASRDLAGFEFLRSGAEVATAWGFAATNANPHNDFDGGHEDWNVIFPGVDGPTPTIYWELCREGVDDCRYVMTLQERIALATRAGRIEAAQRAEQVLAPLLAADAPAIENPATFARYRWRIAREILNLLEDQELATSLSFTAVADNSAATEQIGPNLVENPSFESPAGEGRLPSGRYSIGYPQTKGDPAGALQVTDEVAHSGRYSLKWDLSKVADAESATRAPRWMTVNVSLPSDTVKRLRGKRFKAGYWFRLGSGTTTPGLQVRQYLTDGPGDGSYYRGGIQDPAVWNHFETEGRFGDDLQSMDIHTWCTVPEAERARGSFFYMDDFSLEVIDDPPLTISTPLDEYYVGESIPWTVSSVFTGQIKVALLAGERPIAEQTRQAEAGALKGAFETRGLAAGVYTVQATQSEPDQSPHTVRRQVIVTPDPFVW